MKKKPKNRLGSSSKQTAYVSSGGGSLCWGGG